LCARCTLPTNLLALGVDDLTIKEILRHGDVSVTRASCIKRVDEKSVKAMDRLETELARRRKPVQTPAKCVKSVPLNLRLLQRRCDDIPQDILLG
jgi:hypothetical protein